MFTTLFGMKVKVISLDVHWPIIAASTSSTVGNVASVPPLLSLFLHETKLVIAMAIMNVGIINLFNKVFILCF